MDISLLSQLIKELLPAKGQVTLPRIGIFKTETSPAWFSENGRVINPPSKKITFSRDFDQSDSTLIEEYAAKIGAPVEEVEEQSGTFFGGLLAEKNRTGYIVLPGLGKLDFANDDTVTFRPESGQNLFSDRYGLEPLNLRKIDIRDKDDDYVVLSDGYQKYPTSKSEKILQAIKKKKAPEASPVATSPEDALAMEPAIVLEIPERLEEVTEDIPVIPDSSTESAPTPESPESPETPESLESPETPETPSEVSPEPEHTPAPAPQISDEPVQSTEPSPEPSPEPAPKPAPKPATQPSPAPSTKETHRKMIITISILLGVFILAAVIILMGRSGSLDTLLYSEEELQLIESAGSGK